MIKLKYHEIDKSINKDNIPVSICTMEQLQAYLYALDFNYKELYKKADTGIQKSEIVKQYINICMDRMKKFPKENINIDCVFCCLNAGLQNFIENDCRLYNENENIFVQIGIMFPANYL